jgi:hypothetical protein
VIETQVECYSGYRYGEQPRAFYWQGARLSVTAVLSRWRAPYSDHFLVKTADSLVFELRYQESTGEWQVKLSAQA